MDLVEADVQTILGFISIPKKGKHAEKSVKKLQNVLVTVLNNSAGEPLKVLLTTFLTVFTLLCP